MSGTESSTIKESEVWPAEIEISSNNWIYPIDFFQNHTPSRANEMSYMDELKARYRGYKLVTYMGGQLKLHTETVLDALILFHRFYMRNGITPNFPKYCATFVFIACKVQENHRKIDEIACVAARIVHNDDRIDKQSPQFWEWRDEILQREGLVLQQLCFDLSFEDIYDKVRIVSQSLKTDETKLMNDKFFLRKEEIFKNCLKSIEDWLFLPLFSLFTSDTIIVTSLMIQVHVMNKMMGAEKTVTPIKFPPNFVSSNFNVDIKSCYEVFKFVISSLKLMIKEPSAVSSISDLTKSDFFDILNEKNGDHDVKPI